MHCHSYENGKMRLPPIARRGQLAVYHAAFWLSLVVFAGCNRQTPSPGPSQDADSSQVSDAATSLSAAPNRELDKPVTPDSLGDPAASADRIAPADAASATADPPAISNPPAIQDPAILGINALRDGDVDSAYRYARAAISASPDDPQVVFLMARVLGERHRFPEAIRMLDRLADSAPETRFPALGQTAQWLVSQGDLVEAAERLQTILREIPNAAVAHRELAAVRMLQGKRYQAARHLLELCRQGNIEEAELRSILRIAFPFAADAADDNREPRQPAAIARNQIGQGQWQEAAATLVASDNDDDAALLARIDATQSNTARLAEWAAETEPDGDDVDAWYAMGTHHAVGGRHRLAARCFAEAVIRDSTDADSYRLLSRSLQELELDRSSRQASERAELIEKTHQIGSQMASGSNSLAAISELTELLQQLKRPAEALAWQAVGLAYNRSSLSPQQLRQRVTEINQQRLELVAAESPAASDDFLVCGVDLQQLRAEGDQ